MTPALRAHDLAVGYDGRPVVGGIGLSLAPGTALAIVGTNGSGKTTLLKTIVGLLPAVGGTLSVLGGPPGAAPARVAYLGQFHPSGFALPLRAADVVAMARFPRRRLLGRLDRGDRRAVADGLERMGIAHLADAPLASLSGGQQQRVYLAQALAWQADLLVLDEPTAGLDPAGRGLLAEALAAERRRGAAVAVTTHDIADATSADHALLLAGRVVACGPPGEVVTRDALLETFGLVIGEPGGLLALDTEHGHGHDDPPPGPRARARGRAGAGPRGGESA